MEQKILGKFIGDTHRNMLAIAESKFAKYGIGRGEHIYLFYIKNHKGCSQKELGDELCTDKSLVTRIIKKLESKGFITKRASLDDKRLFQLYLTKLGESALKSIWLEVKDLSEIIREGLTKEEYEETIRCLEIINKNLRKLREETLEEKKNGK